jgi:hypothetical protein
MQAVDHIRARQPLALRRHQGEGFGEGMVQPGEGGRRVRERAAEPGLEEDVQADHLRERRPGQRVIQGALRRGVGHHGRQASLRL